MNGHDPGGKFTVFELLTLLGALAGAIAGWLLGFALGELLHVFAGYALGTVGAILGFVLGSIPGRSLGDYAVLSLFRQLNQQDTARLRERLEPEYFLSHVMILILLGRDEPAAPLENHVLTQLISDSADRRFSAWRALNMCFPETAVRLGKINPMESPEIFRDAVEANRPSCPQ